MMKVTVIGVAGGTGSGKSTLVAKLLDAFGTPTEGADKAACAVDTTENVDAAGSPKVGECEAIRRPKIGEGIAMLCHDSYYKANPELSMEERRRLNYDHPAAFDTAMMVRHLKALKRGETALQPVYSFVDYDRTPDTVAVRPSRVVIVDGILIFENRELRELMDIKVFVDTDADVRLARRVMRDVCDRGRSIESVINQYLTTVKPMHEEFVEPSKRYADVIIPEGGFNSVAVAMLIENIKSLIGR